VAEITYLDLSTAARRIAEARAAARGLSNIEFHTGSLLDAGDFGEFDYIDCCGVLHHLPDPQAGFDALAGALAPGAGWASWSTPRMGGPGSTRCNRPSGGS
jgi:2-polyprenyl-3-methyl-5-hydroxy-6-metoxy-1,4-benzoquinol methylase